MSKDYLALTKQTMEECLEQGFAPPHIRTSGRSAHQEVVRRMSLLHGVEEGIVWGWIGTAEANPKYQPNYSLYRAFQYTSFMHDRQKIEAYRPTNNHLPLAKPKKVGIVGDAHDAPSIPNKDRFYWIGKWSASQKHDILIQMGDMASFDSLTGHSKPGSLSYGRLPSFQEDLDSLDLALSEIDRGLGRYKVEKIFIMGNHEARAYRYEESNPQMVGLVASQIVNLFEQHGWRVVPFKEICFIEGIGFTHHATNIMGTAYGGVTADSRIGKDSTFTVFHGHDHRRAITPSPKIGPVGHVDVVSVGCALPYMHVEDYTKHGPSGWWWGVVEAEILQGNVPGIKYISMLELEECWK